MPVYVDDVRFAYRGMIMCHMWSESEDELHAMADAIGVARRWFQRPPAASWAHYDICRSKRRLAVALGAVEADRFGALAFVAEQRGDEVMLRRIAARRESRQDVRPEIPRA